MADATGRSTPLTGIPAYARDAYRKKLLSRQYTRSPLFGAIVGMGGGDGDLRPGSFGLVGGGAIPRARKKSLLGGYSNNLFFQTGTSSGTANLTARGTVPAVSSPTTDSQDQQRKSAYFKWSKKMTEVLVWNTTLELGAGQFALGDAKLEAQNIGMQHHFNNFIDELWKGSPADWTADILDEQPGVNDVCDDNNTYGGVDRSVAGNAGWRGNVDTTSRAPALDLVETYHVTLVGSYTQSVQDIHEGFDLVLWNRDAWPAVKAEAKSVGINTNRNSGDIPAFAKAGILREGFFYNDTFHTYDPGLKDYSGTSGEPDLSNGVLFTKANDWCFMTHPQGAFSIGKWVNIATYTESGKDAHRTLIKTIYQWWNERAWGSFLATGIA